MGGERPYRCTTAPTQSLGAYIVRTMVVIYGQWPSCNEARSLRLQRRPCSSNTATIRRATRTLPGHAVLDKSKSAGAHTTGTILKDVTLCKGRPKDVYTEHPCAGPVTPHQNEQREQKPKGQIQNACTLTEGTSECIADQSRGNHWRGIQREKYKKRKW